MGLAADVCDRVSGRDRAQGIGGRDALPDAGHPGCADRRNRAEIQGRLAPCGVGRAQFRETRAMNFPYARALITGVGGQDGALLAARLLASGVEVTGTHRPRRDPALWRLRELGIDADPLL